MDNSSERETVESVGLKITLVPKKSVPPPPTRQAPAAPAEPPAEPFRLCSSHVLAHGFTAGSLSSVPMRLCLSYLSIYFLLRSHL